MNCAAHRQRRGKPRKDEEHQHQAALIRWSLFSGRMTFPELDLLTAIPNGGARDARVGAKLKAEGVKPGFPDLILPVPRSVYHGLFIEMKAPDGVLKPAQRTTINKLRVQGYCVVVAYGWDEAKKVIELYLNGCDVFQAVLS